MTACAKNVIHMNYVDRTFGCSIEVVAELVPFEHETESHRWRIWQVSEHPRTARYVLAVKAMHRLRKTAIARVVLAAQAQFSARMSVVSPFHGNDIHVISDSYLKMLGELGVVPWDWEKAESACKEVLLRVDDWF